MRHDFLNHSLGFLRFQRNILSILAILLTLSVVTLSLLLLSKRERVVIVPPTVEKSFWVDQRGVSATYLEQYGYFLAQLMLCKSSNSASSQRDVLLRHTDPSFLPILRRKLLEEENRLKRQSASYVYYPTSVVANRERNEVVIEGDRLFYVSDKRVSSQPESYLLRFRYTGSRLLLTEIAAMGEGDD